MAEEQQYNFFHYVPDLGFNAAFLAIFSALTILHFGLTLRSRIHWGHVAVVGGLGEVIGWIGRLLGHFNEYSLNYYLINQVCLAVSPVFWSATCYVVFGRLIVILGPEYSRLSPRNYVIVFVVIDVLSLILQGVGGGMSGAAAGGAGVSLQTGRDIYLAGISFQLFNMLVFVALVVEFFIRLRLARRRRGLAASKEGLAEQASTPEDSFALPLETPQQKRAVKLAVWGLLVASFMIIFRNFYRDVELGQGFDGYLARHELWFMMDSIPMVICFIALAVSHPLFTFRHLPSTAGRWQDMKAARL